MPKGKDYKGIGRHHPASKSVPGGDGGRSAFGRDYPHTGKVPAGGKIPTLGRDHPDSKGPEIPPMTNPFGTE